MADIKTHYRELSFAIKIHSLIHNVPLSNEVFDPNVFLKECRIRIDNSVDIAENILSESMNNHFYNIIKNGFKLAELIYTNYHFKFSKNNKIYWFGYETQKKRFN